MKQLSKKNKYIIAGIVSAVVIVLIALTVAYGCVLINSDRILSGVHMGDTDLEGRTREDAAQLIYDSINPPGETELLFECDGTAFAVTATQAELSADAEVMAEKAYNIGKEGNLFVRIRDAYSALLFGENIAPEFTLSETKLSAAIADNLADKVVDITPYSVEIVSDGLMVRNGIGGRGVAELDIAQRIFADLTDNGVIDNIISLTITDIPAQPIVFDEFCSEYIREAKDATYETRDGEYIFTPEVEGISFDVETARKIIEENIQNTEAYHIPATVTIPEVTVAQLQSKFAVDVLGTYTTNYASSDANRASNVALAASKVNGVVLNPGERFSFNNIVGPRTAATGFKVAHVYEGDRVVDGMGGGICQVSSTLYNAVLLADLKIVYRTNHSMPVSYVPLGRDATVSYGSIDFIFENNKKHPVTIVATTQNRNLTVSVKGVDESDGTTIEIVTENAGYTAFTTKETVDNSLAPGEKKVIKNGSNGSIYNSYKRYKKDGAIIKTVHIARSNYIPVAKIVAVGPAKTEEVPPSEPVVNPVVSDEPEDIPEQTEPTEPDAEAPQPVIPDTEEDIEEKVEEDVPASAEPVETPDADETSEENLQPEESTENPETQIPDTESEPDTEEEKASAEV